MKTNQQHREPGLTPWPEVARRYNEQHGTSLTPRAVEKIAERAQRKLREALVTTGVDASYLGFVSSLRVIPQSDINFAALLAPPAPNRFADDPHPYRSLDPNTRARRKRD